MRTLYERLKPVIKVKMEDSRIEYPNIIDDLEKHLRSIQYVSDLKYTYIMDLIGHCGVVLNYPSNTPYDWFVD